MRELRRRDMWGRDLSVALIEAGEEFPANVLKFFYERSEKLGCFSKGAGASKRLELLAYLAKSGCAEVTAASTQLVGGMDQIIGAGVAQRRSGLVDRPRGCLEKSVDQLRQDFTQAGIYERLEIRRARVRGRIAWILFRVH